MKKGVTSFISGATDKISQQALLAKIHGPIKSLTIVRRSAARQQCSAWLAETLISAPANGLFSESIAGCNSDVKL